MSKKQKQKQKQKKKKTNNNNKSQPDRREETKVEKTEKKRTGLDAKHLVKRKTGTKKK
jgi:hypothetical protein